MKLLSHIIAEYYSPIEKNKILSLVTTCVGLKGIMLSDISQGKTNADDLTYMWNLKPKPNPTEIRHQTHRYREQIGGGQSQGIGGGRNGGRGSKGISLQL